MTKTHTQNPVVVIGAGMGGLAATLSLRARGVPVILLERHATPGGKMRQLKVAGQLIDSGPTVFTMRWVFEALFAQAGLKLDEHLKLRKADLLARHSWVGSEALDLYPDIESSMEAIAAFASARDADNYRKFAQRTEEVFNTLDKPFMQAQKPNPIALTFSGGFAGMINLANTQPFVTLWRYLAKNFEDPRLRQLFARYATYCGSSPFKAPATLMLIAHVERAGVWLVDGGMQALANTLATTVQQLGAECRFGQGVASLETDKGCITGVILDSGEHIKTRAVIFNGDTQALAGGLLGDDATRAAGLRKEASLSAVTRCQFAKTSGFELAHHTVFFGEDYADEFNSIFNSKRIAPDTTVYVCAQDRGNAKVMNQHGVIHERLFSLVNAPATPMTDAQQATAIEHMQKTLNDHGLSIEDEQGATLVTNPTQFNHLFPASDGALYGRPTHGWLGSFNRPGSKSGIRGVYLAGGSVHPGAGVPMATLSGQLAANRLCQDFGYQ